MSEVTYSKTLKIGLPEYSSEDIHISLTLSVDEGESYDEKYTEAKDWVLKKVEVEQEAILNQVDNETGEFKSKEQLDEEAEENDVIVEDEEEEGYKTAPKATKGKKKLKMVTKRKIEPEEEDDEEEEEDTVDGMITKYTGGKTTKRKGSGAAQKRKAQMKSLRRG